MSFAWLTGCSDDNDEEIVVPSAGWKVSVLGGSAVDVDDEGAAFFGREATYGSLRLQLEGYDRERDGQVRISLTDGSSWLTIDNDTLGTDGIISLATKENTDDQLRTATLQLLASNGEPPQQALVTVSQRSSAEQDANGGNAKEDLYVGYGYDIFKALDNPMSVRVKTPILDLQKLREAGNSATYETVHDSRLSRTEMKYVASSTLYEYSEDLTQQQTQSTVKLSGCKVDCDMAASFNVNVNEQNFGRGSMVKTVAARVIDKAALLHLRQRNQMPYTTPFLNRVNNLLTLQITNPSVLDEEITKTLEEYGTHLVLQADLGGRLDYTFTMTKSGTVHSKNELVEEVDFTMGRLANNQRTPSYAHSVSSKKNVSGAIKVTGGMKEAKARLEADIAQLGTTSQLPPDHVTEWLASISYDDRALIAGDIDVIHFELMPLWDLVPDKLREPFLNATLKMVERPDCKVSDDKLGTDLYTIDCTRSDLFDFSNVGDDGSLCRILYLKSGEAPEGAPVLEVCSEYVPKIRTDQRVTMVYPIYKKKIRMNEGLFLGDGIHQPAYVGFGGAECFVSPLTELKNTDIITHINYVNGSLSIGSENARFISEDQRGRTVRDDAFYFRVSGTTHKHPIVKIGSNFWTRRDLNHKMGLALKPSDDRTLDQLKDGIVYARFWHDLGRSTSSQNKWMWGYDPNTMFPGNPNMKWYYPSGDEVKNLLEFMGFNPKALFKGQATGFEAQFNGYYGGYDVEAKEQTDDPQVRAKGELNCFATRNKETDNGSILMVLDKNYRLYVAETGASGIWRQNYYPVRPTRGYMYNYPTLKDYLDFEEKYK